MSARRLTNNSVSTLEEQSEVIQSVISKETGGKISDSKDKKLRKRKLKQSDSVEKRAKKSDKPAALGSAEQAVMADGQDDDQSGHSGHWPTWSQAQAEVAMHEQDYDYVDPDWVEEEDSVMDSDLGDRPIHEMSDDDTVSNVSHVDPQLQMEAPVIPGVPEVKKKGIFANILKENIARVKEADKVSKKLSEEVAFGVDKYLKECLYTSEMEKLAKEHPRVENVEFMKVPRLDVEVYQVVEQKVRNNDQSLQTVQKAIVSSMSALSPLLELAFERADGDKELDECAKGLWESIQLMAFALNGVSSRRRELIKPSLAPVYARVLTKGHETTPDWLYGGNLLETTKKCEASKRLSDKILKPKPQPQQKVSTNFRGRGQSSRGRGQHRGSSYQNYKHQGQQQQQYQQHQQAPAQFYTPMEFPRVPKQQFQFQQQQQSGHQGFPKNKANNFQK